MITLLPLLLALAPADAPSPDEAHACVVEWGAQHDDEMFIEITEPRILQRCDELLVAMGFEALPNSIHVELGGEMLAFTAKISLLDEGGDVRGTIESEGDPCKCGPGKTADFVMQILVQLVEDEQDTSAADEREPGQLPVLGPKPVAGEELRCPRHVLRWTGVGVALAGVALGVTGGVLMSRTKTEPAETDDRIGSRVERVHPLALTGSLVGGGVVAIVTGVVLIVVDDKRSKRAKKTTLAPSFGPHHTGLLLTGKF